MHCASHFGTEIVEHLPIMRRYALALMPLDAEDLVNDTVARALSREHLFQPGTDMRSWLCTILHHQYVNLIRKRIRESKLIVADLSLADRVGHEGSAITNLVARDLGRCLAQLPEKHLRIVLMAMDQSYDEISYKEGVPVGTIRSRLSRGREELRLRMNGLHDKKAIAAARRKNKMEK